MHQTRLKNEITILISLVLICLVFSLIRCYLTSTSTYIFLIWNLFLAAVPWLITSVLHLRGKPIKHPLILSSIVISWLIFFPNAPYILTDLYHIRLKSGMPLWYDLMLILSYAFTGLIFGFISLRNIERILKPKLSGAWIVVGSILALFIASFGVYLGRFLRWNSWDLLHHPKAICIDILDRFTHPLDHPRTWGLTIFLGVFLNMIYWSIKRVKLNVVE